ncbi:hypothetical protein ACLB2K_073534 [Fragaria x ananassa]
MHDVANNDSYFIQKPDASSWLGLLTKQKLTCSMRMLAYGLPADLCDEFLDIAESIAFEILSQFTRAIWKVYILQTLPLSTIKGRFAAIVGDTMLEIVNMVTATTYTTGKKPPRRQNQKNFVD